MQKIVTHLWFDSNAEEAVAFYISVFKHSKIVRTSHYSEASALRLGRTPGSALSIVFELEGQEFAAINGGPGFSFSPAVSLLVNCKHQMEVDDLWEKLSEGGSEEQCGWLRDKFGVSWQIVPTALVPMMEEASAATDRVFTAMLEMKKLDLAVLTAAYEAEPDPSASDQ